MNDVELNRFFFSLSLYFVVENAYNAVQDILSVYGLAMSTTDIMDAFNKKADAAAAAAAVSIRDLATSCEYLIVYILHFNSRVQAHFPLSNQFNRSLCFIYND